MSDQTDFERSIRERFGAQIPIRHEMPTGDDLIRDKTTLELIASKLGLEAWMLRTKKGLIVAIIVVPAALWSFAGTWKDIATTGSELARPYLTTIQSEMVELGDQLVAFLPEPPPVGDPKGDVPRTVIAPLAKASRHGPPPGPDPSSEWFSQPFDVSLKVWRAWGAESMRQPLDTHDSQRAETRWGSRGIPFAYASTSPLVALEEVTAHHGDGRKWKLYEIELEGKAQTLAFNDPRQILAPERAEHRRQIGKAWHDGGRSTILFTPSPVVPAAETVIMLAGKSQATVRGMKEVATIQDVIPGSDEFHYLS